MRGSRLPGRAGGDPVMDSSAVFTLILTIGLRLIARHWGELRK